jgi:hypothetical protein
MFYKTMLHKRNSCHKIYLGYETLPPHYCQGHTRSHVTMTSHSAHNKSDQLVIDSAQQRAVRSIISLPDSLLFNWSTDIQTIQCFYPALIQIATAQISEPITWKNWTNDWRQTNGNERTKILETLGRYGQFWWQWEDTDNFDDTGQIQIILMTLSGYGQFWWH